MILRLIFLCFFCSLSLYGKSQFVVLIPSYNNETWCIENIKSALEQKYEDYRIIFVNDCSTDKTLQLVSNFVKREYPHKDVKIIANPKRKRAMQNFYETIHNEVEDYEIVVCLDGDDLLCGTDVLTYLDQAYSNPHKEVWLTFGQFKPMHGHFNRLARPVSAMTIKKNLFRKKAFRLSHLRTFYAWLFKRVREEDFKDEKGFYRAGCDVAMMFPMIEMAGDRFQFIRRVLYIYNDDNPINIHRHHHNIQVDVAKRMKQKKPYKPLKHSDLIACEKRGCPQCSGEWSVAESNR